MLWHIVGSIDDFVEDRVPQIMEITFYNRPRSALIMRLEVLHILQHHYGRTPHLNDFADSKEEISLFAAFKSIGLPKTPLLRYTGN